MNMGLSVMVWLHSCVVVELHTESEGSDTCSDRRTELEHLMFECKPRTDFQSVNLETSQTICSESCILLLSA